MKKSLCYNFILNMWIMNRVNEHFVNTQVRFKRITQDEADMILSTPRNEEVV